MISIQYNNALIFYLDSLRMAGDIITAFEYFLYLYEQDKNFKLIILDLDKKLIDEFHNIMNDRYNFSGIDNYKDNVIILKRSDLFHVKFNKVLVVDHYTISKTRGILRANKIVVICNLLTDNRDFRYNKNCYNVIYYGEMPFHNKDREYKMKFLLNRFKDLKNVKEGIYVNSPFNNDYSFLKKLTLPEKPIIKKSRIHHQNLFEAFDTYLYYHANKWFDPCPRLFIECFYYNKKIIYYNELNIKDGSFYRYNSIINEGLENRFFNENDEIINEIL